MGMIANYQYINDEQLNSLKNSDSKENDVLAEVEEMNEESEMLLDTALLSRIPALSRWFK